MRTLLNRRHRHRRGFTMLSILMAVMIIGILTQSYMSAEGPDGRTFADVTRDRATAAVTAMNLRMAETDFFMRTEGRTLPPVELRRVLDDLSIRMGTGGRFFLTPDRQLHNTVMMQTPLFADQFASPELPRKR